MITYDKFFINGEWVAPSSDARIDVVGASTGEPLGSVPEAVAADVDTAVRAARAAFDDPQGWAHWTPERRAEVLNKLADAVDAKAAELGKLVSQQNGMPISMSVMLEGGSAGIMLRYYASMMVETPAEEYRAGMFGGKSIIRREPIGVVGAIAPFNYPQALAAFKYAPALAAGCTVVLKPSPETVLDAMLLAEVVAESDLPAGVLNIIPGGREAGETLVEHPGVDKIAFTGSTAIGRKIGEVCGRLLRPVTLELGGKSAAIILDDASLDLAEIGQNLFGATMANSGQTCYLGTRVLAPASRYDEVVDTFEQFAKSLVVGDPLDEATQIGPVVTEKHRERVEGYIAQGSAEGARLVTGGGRPKGLDKGWYVEPTIFADVDNDSTIAREEIFGPVLSIIKYGDENDAVRVANESAYGLGGSDWSADPERALGVARRVQTGTIGINGYISDLTAPFGGVKDSGLGYELGPEGLAPYLSIKSMFPGG